MTRVALIGAGRMGAAMARRLLAGGHDLLVYNRTAKKAAELERSGARVATSVAAACVGREVVISMVADDAALYDVVLGSAGICDSLPKGATHAAMGTHGVEAIRAVGAAHDAAQQKFVAAPVLGRPEAVEAGELGIVAAGSPGALAVCGPVFKALGRRVFEAGPSPESATAIKLANNFLLACCIESLGEAFALARKYEVAPRVLYDVLTDGLFAAPAFKVYGRIIADEDYEHVGFSARLGLKDTNLVLAAAEAAQVPLPSASLVRQMLQSVIAHGDGDCDWSVIARQQARESGLG